MPNITPSHYTSIQDMLNALGFEINSDFYVKGGNRFPLTEIIGHTTQSFYGKMQKEGWLQEEPESMPFYQWGDQFVVMSDLIERVNPW